MSDTKLRNNAACKKYYRKNKIEILLHKRKRYSVLKKNPTWKKKNNRRIANSFNARYEKKKVEVAGRPRAKVCEIPNCGRKDKIVFDHDHKTGKFRGWICAFCNSALGFARENKEVLKSLILYLDIHERHTPTI